MAEIMDITEPTKTAQTTAPDTEPSGWMSPTGEIRDGAPDNVRTLLEAKKWNTVEQIVDNYNLLEKQQGIGEHLVIPNADDPEFASKMGNIYNQFGRPETYDKYEFTNETDVKIDDELLDSFKQYAHKEGYSQKQLAGAIQFQLDAVAAGDKIYETKKTEQREENITAMKSKWGETQYEPTVRRIDVTAEKFGVLEFFKTMGIDKEPEIVNMLLTISNSDAEDTITTQTELVAKKTPQEEVEEIKKSESFLKKFDPKHKETMARFVELNQIIANSGQGRATR